MFWTEVIGASKPTMTCKLSNEKATAHLSGMMDTGADVTIISSAGWASQWGLKHTLGTVSGIRGTTPSMQSATNIVVEGPDGHTASIRAFIVPSGFTALQAPGMPPYRTEPPLTIFWFKATDVKNSRDCVVLIYYLTARASTGLSKK